MARMRYLKPEFWTDSVIIKLSPFARLLFQGTWNFAMCEAGHLHDDPEQLKLQVLPADDVDPFALVDELVTAGRLVRFTGTDGRNYLQVKRLSDHQKTDSRWSPRCPACRANPEHTRENSPKLPETPETAANLPETLPNSPQEGMGGEGRGKEKKTSSSSGRKRPATKLPEDWMPTDVHRTYASEHHINLDREVFKFRHHAEANDRRQASWNGAFSQWLANATDWGSSSRGPRPTLRDPRSGIFVER